MRKRNVRLAALIAAALITCAARGQARKKPLSLEQMLSIPKIERNLARMYFGKTPREDPEIYQKPSPLTYAANVKTPVLLTHNEKDERVSLEQAIEFFRAVQATGRPVEHYVYPGKLHGTLKPNHQLDTLRKTKQ